MTELKLGKRPARSDHRDLRLVSYLDVAAVLPTVPARFGFGRLYPDWGMLGNDSYGDCVFASAAHQTMIFNKVRHGADVLFDDQAVLSDYSAVTGFDPNDPSTDQGTDVRTALSYRRSTGIADATGGRHTIAAYVALDPKDWRQLLVASYVFGAAEIGFEFPASAMQQFDSGTPWDTVPSSPLEGGHDVPVVGSMLSSTKATCITWGKRQELTKGFYEAYNDEAYAVLSPELLRSDQRGLHNFDWATFQADLAALA